MTPSVHNGRREPLQTEAWGRYVAYVPQTGYRIHWVNVPITHDAFGMTDFTTREVFIVSGLDTRQQTETLIHELGHVLLHRHFVGQKPGAEEDAVESVAIVLTWEEWGWYKGAYPPGTGEIAQMKTGWDAATRRAYETLKAIGEGRTEQRRKAWHASRRSTS